MPSALPHDAIIKRLTEAARQGNFLTLQRAIREATEGGLDASTPCFQRANEVLAEVAGRRAAAQSLKIVLGQIWPRLRVRPAAGEYG